MQLPEGENVASEINLCEKVFQIFSNSYYLESDVGVCSCSIWLPLTTSADTISSRTHI